MKKTILLLTFVFILSFKNYSQTVENLFLVFKLEHLVFGQISGVNLKTYRCMVAWSALTPQIALVLQYLYSLIRI